MTPAELERANTWLIEITEALIEGVKWREEGDEHHALGQGGLTINTRKGCWHQHSTGKGGWNALSLVAQILRLRCSGSSGVARTVSAVSSWCRAGDPGQRGRPVY